MLGLLELDLAHPHQALDHFKDALALREKLLGLGDWGIGISIGNIGLAYLEIGDLERRY